MWTSADGHDWSRVPDLPAELATQGAPDQVVAGPTGVVVHIGGNADADTSFWSRDGRTWVALDAAGGPALPKALSGLPISRNPPVPGPSLTEGYTPPRRAATAAAAGCLPTASRGTRSRVRCSSTT